MIHNEEYSSRYRDALSQLLRVTTLMTEDMQRGLERHGLTQARAHVLWILGPAERMTQRELADALKVTPRNVTTLVDALEATGFLRRAAHPSDRRAIVVTLTQKGRQAVSRLRLEMTRLAESLFGDVPANRLRAFREILQDIGARLLELQEIETAAPRR
jgi:DNA-binding MarR family transcriptional regulator